MILAKIEDWGKMPEHCGECRVQIGTLIGWCPLTLKATPRTPNKRPEWCPLEEVEE